MQLQFIVTDTDVRRVRDFYENWATSPVVERRIKQNVEGKRPTVDREGFWFVMVNCLLSSQQRSGPKSALHRFVSHNPYPLSWDDCQVRADLEAHTTSTLAAFGLRFGPTIARYVRANRDWLQRDGWSIVLGLAPELDSNATIENERASAAIVAKYLDGFGPKQSRNLLQSLGLTRYEIPIDSRIADWLNVNEFPVKISANALSDPSYYDLISDGFQQLCSAANLLPCLLDAAIFASYDPPWASDDVIW